RLDSAVFPALATCLKRVQQRNVSRTQPSSRYAHAATIPTLEADERQPEERPSSPLCDGCGRPGNCFVCAVCAQLLCADCLAPGEHRAQDVAIWLIDPTLGWRWPFPLSRGND